MFSVLKIYSRTIGNNIQFLKQCQNSSYYPLYTSVTPFNDLVCTHFQTRHKSKKSSKSPQVTESEPEESSNADSVDVPQNKHSKVMKLNVAGQRVDAVLKSALGISRNKIDAMFYENRIRVNGEKLLKKNVPINDGDEIDLIKGVSPTNPEYLSVARVEVLGCVGKEDTIEVKVRRFKALLVENYPGANMWKE